MGEHSIVDHDRGAVEKISHLEIIITLRDLGKGDIRGIDQVRQHSAQEGRMQDHVCIHYDDVLTFAAVL
jgi:hypothetical protein